MSMCGAFKEESYRGICGGEYNSDLGPYHNRSSSHLLSLLYNWSDLVHWLLLARPLYTMVLVGLFGGYKPTLIFCRHS